MRLRVSLADRQVAGVLRNRMRTDQLDVRRALER